MRKLLAIVVLALFLLVSSGISTVEAFYYHSEQTTPSIVNQPWGFLATTDDPSVVRVRFQWFYGGPFGTDDETFANSPPFQSSIIPDKPGDWYVLISFLNAAGGVVYTDSHLENFPPDFVVPEYAFLGSAGALVAAFLGLVFFKKLKSAKKTAP